MSDEMDALRSFARTVTQCTDYWMPTASSFDEIAAAFCEQFMYVGHTVGLPYVVHSYQHRTTHRHLNVDPVGNPYIQVGGIWIMVSTDAALVGACS